MIANLGYSFLWLCLFSNLFQLFFTFKNKYKNTTFLLRIASIGILLSCAISFFCLMYLHLISDFSVKNVFENSHTTKPLLYKISGVWGNHEGSMLLWILILALFNYFIFKTFDKKNVEFIYKSLQTQSLITIGFLIFIIFTSNPFLTLEIIPNNGLGFNPILQDPALAIHPPMLYIGYVGLSAVFSMSIGVLRTSKPNEIPWHNYFKPFVISAWSFLTAGIAVGSIWAYYELGWGGFWFWDPVENASLMPWLITTALMHSLISVENKKILKLWVLFLSILAFLLSISGTFLVRSGILTSVHTFALDPTRGIYILIFFAFLGTYSLSIFANKANKFLDEERINLLSKESSILINNLIMILVCLTILFGTIYPLFVEIFSSNKISVGEPYFNSTVIPMIIPAALIMGFGPILNWGRFDKLKFYKQTIWSFFITLLMSLIFIINYKNFYGFIGLIMGTWIIVNVGITFIFNAKKNFNKIGLKIFKYINSVFISHLGFGILVIAITCSSVWKEEKILRMKIEDQTIFNNQKIIFKDINQIVGPNYIGFQGEFYLFNNKDKLIHILKPEKRLYVASNNTSSEVSIHSNIFRDIYIVLGDKNSKNSWVINLYFNPLVIWIWIGAFVIFLGGLIALFKSLTKLKNA